MKRARVRIRRLSKGMTSEKQAMCIWREKTRLSEEDDVSAILSHYQSSRIFVLWTIDGTTNGYSRWNGDTTICEGLA
jgi:hypothetical protein